MKIQTQRSSDMSTIAEKIDGIRIAMLTNAADNGALRSRPMAPLELDADGALWFFTNEFSGKTHHLQAVNVAFADVARSTFVSLAGAGSLVDDRQKIHALWSSFAKPWFPDGPDAPDLTLLRFAPDAAEYWDAPNSRMVRLAAMAVSSVAGKPIGLGEHGDLKHLST